MAARRLVSDSRFTTVQDHGLDFYANTMTIYGGIGAPPELRGQSRRRPTTAIAATLAADADKARVDATWRDRVTIGPRDPGAVQRPAGDVPCGPAPDAHLRLADGLHVVSPLPAVHPGFVYFNVQGTIRTVPVMNSREFYLFPTGRVLVRFRNFIAGVTYPTTIANIADTWGAYHILPEPELDDVLHRLRRQRLADRERRRRANRGDARGWAADVVLGPRIADAVGVGGRAEAGSVSGTCSPRCELDEYRCLAFDEHCPRRH